MQRIPKEASLVFSKPIRLPRERDLRHALKISAFPKCYIDQIAGERTMSVFDWIEMARSLDADGLEMYDGFFTSLDDAYIDRVGEAIRQAGFAMPMLCCSPDFTNPDPDARKRADRPRGRADPRRPAAGRAADGLPGPLRPALSGGEPRAGAGVGRRVHRRRCCRSRASTTSSSAWRTTTRTASGSTPSSPRSRTSSSSCSPRFPTANHFGVQYDPSNAIVAGDDPIALLRAVADRVVSMHASDRYLAEGATLDDLRQTDGTLGYSPEPAPRRDRQGAERLRRDLPHPGRASVPGLGQHRGRHERHGRDGRIAGVPAADEREVLSRSE